MAKTVVGVDDSTGLLDALYFAINEARLRDATLLAAARRTDTVAEFGLAGAGASR